MNAAGPDSEVSTRDVPEDAWLDEALAQSFPASDPLPWFHGDIDQPEIGGAQDQRPPSS